MLRIAHLLLTTSLSLMGAIAVSAPQPQSAATSSPMAILQLETIDKRSPVPLSPEMANHQKEEMRRHLETVKAIVLALASDDFAAVEKQARSVGFTEKRAAMCADMGAGAPGFTDRALAFHKSADALADTAKLKDKSAVLRALDATLAHCTGCHALYRQQVVDAPLGHGEKHHHPTP